MHIYTNRQIVETTYDGVNIGNTGLVAIQQKHVINDKPIFEKEYIVTEAGADAIERKGDIDKIWSPIDGEYDIVPFRYVENRQKFIDMLKENIWMDIQELPENKSPFVKNPYKYFSTHSYDEQTGTFIFWNSYDFGAYEYDINTKSLKQLSVARAMSYVETHISFDTAKEAKRFAKLIFSLPNCRAQKEQDGRYTADDMVKIIPYYNVSEGEYSVCPFYFYPPQRIFDKYKQHDIFATLKMFKDYLKENHIEYPVYEHKE